MKKFKKIKKGFISLFVTSLVMGSLMGVSMVDIFSISTPEEIKVVEVVPQIIEEVKIEEKITYAVVSSSMPEYVEIKDEAYEIIESKPLAISDGQTIEEKIRIACEIHGVPYDIAMAIARLETGHFKSYAFREKNNPGGLSRNEVPMSFDTIDDGVEAFVGNLGRNYISIGLDTPEKIGKKYCPVNPNWAGLVRSLMREYE